MPPPSQHLFSCPYAQKMQQKEKGGEREPSGTMRWSFNARSFFFVAQMDTVEWSKSKIEMGGDRRSASVGRGIRKSITTVLGWGEWESIFPIGLWFQKKVRDNETRRRNKKGQKSREAKWAMCERSRWSITSAVQRRWRTNSAVLSVRIMDGREARHKATSSTDLPAWASHWDVVKYNGPSWRLIKSMANLDSHDEPYPQKPTWDVLLTQTKICLWSISGPVNTNMK